MREREREREEEWFVIFVFSGSYHTVIRIVVSYSMYRMYAVLYGISACFTADYSII
jgi:hypothetical protein